MRHFIGIRFVFSCVSAFLTNAAFSADPRLQWNNERPTLIQQDGHYGRIARLDGRTWIAGFDHRRSIKVRLSRDDGASWQPAVEVASAAKGSLTNAELLVLGPSEIICLFNFRPERNSGLSFEIRMSRSSDGGTTWSPQQTLFAAGAEFENGCWEPSAVMLPNGEIRIYFANEAPFRTSDEQEISMLRSSDRGRTWNAPERVCFRAKHRDGMPVPVCAPELDRVFIAIEDNGLSGAFKPVIIESRTQDGLRPGSFIAGDSPRRRSALASPLPAATYAGAPYLRRLPDRRFVLSFQIAGTGNMHDSRMAVCLGNTKAGSFGEATYPFGNTPGPQLWNALFVKDENTIIAISETAVRGVRGIWAVEGTVTR